jgi:flagellar basal body rod protein FlgG
MESLDLLANNLANAATGGYKADQEFYSLYRAAETQNADSRGAMPLIERQWTDFSQGLLHDTGNMLDLALSGSGFFAVDGPSGTLYTRNGSFRASPSGQLVTAEGYRVRSVGGGPITLAGEGQVEIAANGTIQQNGSVLGQIEIADFGNTAGLTKQGKTYFRSTDPSIQPVIPAHTAVEQRKLEASNVGTAESTVRLVNVLRQFEMMQKAAGLASEMNKRAVEEVARVGS